MSVFFPSKKPPIEKEEIRVHMDDNFAISQISAGLNRLFDKFLEDCHASREIIFVCIGTDRSTGDCLGPLIGTQLVEAKKVSYSVYGTLDLPVHAGNLSDQVQYIEANHKRPLIVAIDASLGKLDSIGYINLREGSLKPGAGVNKSLPPIGDIHITGIVNVGGFMEYFVLQNTRLSIVMKMATIISKGIERAYITSKNTRS